MMVSSSARVHELSLFFRAGNVPSTGSPSAFLLTEEDDEPMVLSARIFGAEGVVEQDDPGAADILNKRAWKLSGLWDDSTGLGLQKLAYPKDWQLFRKYGRVSSNRMVG